MAKRAILDHYAGFKIDINMAIVDVYPQFFKIVA